MSNITQKYKETKVWSAGKFNLIISIVYIFLVIFGEATILYCIFINQIGPALLLQFLLSPFVILLAVSEVRRYRRRKEFVLYFSRIEDIIDISILKSEYSLCKIDSYGVLFVKKEDDDSYDDWAMYCNAHSTYDVEEKFFKDSTISFITRKEN